MTALHAVPDDIDGPRRSTVDVAAALGITVRQLQFWCQAGYLPSQPTGQGHGYSYHRTFTGAEIDLLHAASALMEGGMTVAAAFTIAGFLTETGRYRTVIGSIYELSVTVRVTPTEGDPA